jgi:hypothetical protein
MSVISGHRISKRQARQLKENSMKVTIKFGTAATAAATAVIGAWLAGNGYYKNNMNPEGFGFAPSPEGGSWLTSGGNFMALAVRADGVTLTYEGRRHGLSGMLEVADWMKEGLVTRYATDTPHLQWWETESAEARLRRTGIRRNPDSGRNEKLEAEFKQKTRSYAGKWAQI